jgi:hypothetical protein
LNISWNFSISKIIFKEQGRLNCSLLIGSLMRCFIVQADDPFCISAVKQSLIGRGKTDFFDL